MCVIANRRNNIVDDVFRDIHLPCRFDETDLSMKLTSMKGNLKKKKEFAGIGNTSSLTDPGLPVCETSGVTV